MYDKATSLLLCGGLSAGFVASMYLRKESRQVGYDRDKIENIKWRLGGGTATAGCALAVVFKGGGALREIGLGEGQLLGIGQSFLLTSVLFAGVIREQIAYGLLDFPSVRALWPTTQQDYIVLRNYIVAPILEEIVFRGATLYLLTPHYAPRVYVPIAASSFALAHVHHLYLYLTSHNTPLAQSLLIVLSNFLVHSIFSLYSIFMYTHTSSLLAAALAHSLCNVLGAPSTYFLGLEDTSLKRQIGFGYLAGITGFFKLAQVLFY